MKRQTPSENTARVIALATAFFGTLAVLGWTAGVFAKLDPDERAALAAFAAGFAVLTYVVDGQVRAALKRGAARVLRGFLNNPIASSSPPRGGSRNAPRAGPRRLPGC